ncbi:MAG: YceD family protein [Bacteroidota bacterium]
MGKKKAFEIAFVGLKPGIHEFTYEVNDEFFAEIENREFTNCVAKIKVQLDKKSSFFLLKFEIGGKADVICDKCGNTLTKDLWDEFNMLVKMVDNPEEMNEQEEDPDVHYISKTESHLTLNDWIFEFVSLSVPYQKMCSEEEFGGDKCNKEVLAKLKEMEAKFQQDNNAGSIWKGLDQFKENKN